MEHNFYILNPLSWIITQVSYTYHDVDKLVLSHILLISDHITRKTSKWYMDRQWWKCERCYEVLLEIYENWNRENNLVAGNFFLHVFNETFVILSYIHLFEINRMNMNIQYTIQTYFFLSRRGGRKWFLSVP